MPMATTFGCGFGDRSDELQPTSGYKGKTVDEAFGIKKTLAGSWKNGELLR